MTAPELHTRLGREDQPFVLDVRSPEEYADGHVPGAVNLPFLRVLAGGTPRGVKKDAPLVVYCGHGPRAHVAMLALRVRGFSHLIELDGHFAEWRRGQMPETRGTAP